MKKIIILVVLAVIIGGGIWWAKGKKDSPLGGSQAVKYAEPADAVDDFYTQWLKAAQDSAAVPNHATLVSAPALTKDLSAKLAAALEAKTTPDPVLCQATTPAGITLRNVYTQTDKAQMLVNSKDKKVMQQAVVTLNKAKDGWVISGIECSNGEVAPVKEFTFEQQGFLIQKSIPKPFNNANWHIVFTQDGKPGNVVPLLFDTKSQCTNTAGVKAVCKLSEFTEAAKVMVHAQMTERGAQVVRMEFVK